GQFLGRELAQLVVDQRQELRGGLRVALLDRVENLGDRVHRPPTKRPTERWHRRRNASAGRAGAKGAANRGATRYGLPATSPSLLGQRGAQLRTCDVRLFRRTALGNRKAPGMKSNASM